ncbi:hypothetical protein VXQ18_06235 [Brucella abortus]|nr:hypothetical protein [Brucella abortus]
MTGVVAYLGRMGRRSAFCRTNLRCIMTGRPQRLYMAQYPDASTFCGIEVDFIAGFGETALKCLIH